MEGVQEQSLIPLLYGSPGDEEEPAKEKEKKQPVRLDNPDSYVLKTSEE